jgi:hypothetical protein
MRKKQTWSYKSKLEKIKELIKDFEDFEIEVKVFRALKHIADTINIKVS